MTLKTGGLVCKELFFSGAIVCRKILNDDLNLKLNILYNPMLCFCILYFIY